MSAKILWMCDGCDSRVWARVAAQPPFRRITVTLGGNENCQSYRDQERAYDLCPRCREKLWQVTAPTDWERPAEPASQPTPGDNQDMGLAVESLKAEGEG